MDLEKYRKLFLEECREHLQGMNRELLRLEEEGEEFKEIDTLFREAHSVKGMAASMGYDSMVALGHAMEDLFAGIRQRTLTPTAEIIALLFQGVDTLGHLADEVEAKGETSLDVASLAGSIREAVSGREATPSAGALPSGEEISLEEGDAGEIPAAEIYETPSDSGTGKLSGIGSSPEDVKQARVLAGEGKNIYHCCVTIGEDSPSVTARNFVILGKITRAAAVIRSMPTLEEVMAGRGARVLEALVATERSREDLSTLFLTIPELTDIKIDPFTVPAEEGPEEGGAGEAQEEIPVPVAEDAAPPGEGGPSLKDASRQLIERYLPRTSSTVRVRTDILDDLINIVGEMIITRDRIVEVSRTIEEEDLRTSIDRIDLLVRNFQDTIMTVRMTPLEVITDRLPRVARDLARMGGKEIRFEIIGKGIELDRAIMDELSDVLIHLVRNAIDHGVESVDDRRGAGKEERALVRLTAGREKDWVWITVEDDGRGIDAAKVKRLACERGLVTAGEAEEMDRHDLLLLTCKPGLSTAEKVSDISGRGVGMDVVKSKVDSFGGTLSIDSRPGEGTRTTIRLPLTLAIVQVLLVTLKGQTFGLPISHVAHTVKVDPGEVEQSQKRSVVRWGGKAVPLRDLGGLLGLPAKELPGKEPVHVILTEQAGSLSGLAVDGFAGAYEAVIKPLGPPLKQIAGLAGATIMGDGSTVLVLDVKALV